MRRILPGTKQPKIAGWRPPDFLPNARYPAMRDVGDRNIFFKGSLSSQHTTLAVSNEASAETDGEPQRIRTVQVGAVSGGTITVQVQIDGRDIFDDSERPVSGAAPMDASNVYLFPAGTPVTTIIEATSGVPTGNGNVAIETEPYALLARREVEPLRGRGRMRTSLRKAQRLLEVRGVTEDRGGLSAYRPAASIGTNRTTAAETAARIATIRAQAEQRQKKLEAALRNRP